ncbi:MAG: metallophosphoesterase family protein [Eubacteriales bacterium]|nr:metallophosphoesterase family protein [Eubacteriales bacterium]
MIFVTGDIHGNPVRFSMDAFEEQRWMAEDKSEAHYCIVLGDFGLVWEETQSRTEKYWLNWLDKKPFTTLFIDGNHENFDRLNAYPVTEFAGGKIHRISSKVYHLMRGEVFILNGLKFFAFGGASSHDISDGIIDGSDKNWRSQAKKLEKEGKYMFRVKNRSWWESELPTEGEMKNGMDNLAKYGNKVDFILTHSPAASEIAILGSGTYEQDVLTRYLEEIRIHTEYKKMFSGHMHVNCAVNDKDLLLYEQIIRVQ